MPWPKGKPRPDEDKEKIARGKKGIPATPAHRKAISEGRKKQEEEKKKGKS